MNQKHRDWLALMLDGHHERPCKETAEALRAAIALYDNLAGVLAVRDYLMLWQFKRDRHTVFVPADIWNRAMGKGDDE